ncbi:hypothetical protein TELCIR_11292 [Teladorsagia circumcincta]|uniref:CHK kinase-like domain-containing protein n=1 Tax=Teladorsagia circumcincta TaxID=45464 RepID=A0A2G9UBX4_TELCI|nr:hypothetical protein TELCIR_11292 [Teladorsagia circumcincta]
MDLHTGGAGLFGTHVTWEDIEEDMHRELSTTASFGPNKSARDVGDGKGFMSKLLLIEADWQYSDKELPEKFMLKVITPSVWLKFAVEATREKNMNNRFSDASSMAGFVAFQKNAHNAEVASYNHLAKLPDGKVNIPKIYCMKKFTQSNPLKGYIIMEYLENTDVDILASFSLGEVRQILRFKAILEASSIDVPPEERKQFLQAPFQAMSTVFMPKEELSNTMLALRTVEGGRLAKHAGRLEEIVPELIDYEWTDKLADKLAFLSGEDRRAHWEELLEDFYCYLEEEIGNRKMPYTLEKGLEMALAKIESMLEDIFDYHDRNMKIRKGKPVV